ncbi:hypothetical protein FG379_001558 [Cryptosporidium bovis]|uniref:uncharacterized protein n=1 Tax=Cryptosporidium bovis TaxID=310047 RepID=UPI00351A10C0|nr:hypothetical protein FG379_001558 [Cryptosporidium bovis]
MSSYYNDYESKVTLDGNHNGIGNEIRSNYETINNYNISANSVKNPIYIENIFNKANNEETVYKPIKNENNIINDLEIVFNKVIKDNKIIEGTIYDIIQLQIKIYNSNDYINDYIYNEVEELIIINTDICKWKTMSDIMIYMINNRKKYKLIFENIKRIKFINNEFPLENKTTSYILDWLFLYMINDVKMISEIYFESCIFTNNNSSFLYKDCKRRRINNGSNENGFVVKNSRFELNHDCNMQSENTVVTDDCLRMNEDNSINKNSQNHDENYNSDINCLIDGILGRIFGGNKYIMRRFMIKDTQLSDYQIYKILSCIFNNNIKINEIIIDRIYTRYYSKIPEILNNNYYGYVKSDLSNIIKHIVESDFNFSVLNKISFSNNSINSKEAYGIFSYIVKQRYNITRGAISERKYEDTDKSVKYDFNKHDGELFIDFSNNFITDDFFIYITKNCSYFKNKIIIDLTGNPLKENGIYLDKSKYTKYNIYVVCEYLFPKTYYDDLLNANINYIDISRTYKSTVNDTNKYLSNIPDSTYCSDCTKSVNNDLVFNEFNYHFYTDDVNDNYYQNYSVANIKNEPINFNIDKDKSDGNTQCSDGSISDNNISLNSDSKYQSTGNENTNDTEYYDDFYDSEDDEDYEEEDEDDSTENDEDEDEDEDEDDENGDFNKNEENSDEQGKKDKHKSLEENENKSYKMKGNCQDVNSKINNLKVSKVKIVEEDDAIESLISETRENYLRFKMGQEKWT